MADVLTTEQIRALDRKCRDAPPGIAGDYALAGVHRVIDSHEELRARLESAEAALGDARWREMTDTIPTSYHRCLVTNGRDIAIGNRTARDGRLTTAFITDSGEWVYAVTHWMPIPQLPALAKANERSRE